MLSPFCVFAFFVALAEKILAVYKYLFVTRRQNIRRARFDKKYFGFEIGLFQHTFLPSEKNIITDIIIFQYS